MTAGVLAVVVVFICGGTAMAYRDGALNSVICGGECPAPYIDPPAPIGLMPTPQLPQVPSAAESHVDADAAAAAVKSALNDDDLGARVGFAAAGASGEPVSTGPDTLTPASTTKILTAFAVLDVMDHDHRFTTSVMTRTASAPDELVLVGGGDPFLDTQSPKKPQYGHVATLAELATRTAVDLKDRGIKKVRLGWDDSLFSGPARNPTWPDGYVATDVVAPVNALTADHAETQGLARAPDPAAAAASSFAARLEKRGITVSKKAGDQEASGEQIAGVQSATVQQIVTSMLVHSDNDAAETLLRHVAIAQDKKATFSGGTRAIREVLTAHGIDTAGLKLYDGSGLSRDNRISPAMLVEVLQRAGAKSDTATLLTSLPIAAFNGTLRDRFGDDNAARGLAHAKSGTLSGVTTLAGTVLDADGSVIYFAVMADDLKVGYEQAKQAEDAVISALAKCRCS